MIPYDIVLCDVVSYMIPNLICIIRQYNLIHNVSFHTKPCDIIINYMKTISYNTIS